MSDLNWPKYSRVFSHSKYPDVVDTIVCYVPSSVECNIMPGYSPKKAQLLYLLLDYDNNPQ